MLALRGARHAAAATFTWATTGYRATAAKAPAPTPGYCAPPIPTSPLVSFLPTALVAAHLSPLGCARAAGIGSSVRAATVHSADGFPSTGSREYDAIAALPPAAAIARTRRRFPTLIPSNAHARVPARYFWVLEFFANGTLHDIGWKPEATFKLAVGEGGR